VSRRRIRKRRHIVDEFAARVQRQFYLATLQHYQCPPPEEWARTYVEDRVIVHALEEPDNG